MEDSAVWIGNNRKAALYRAAFLFHINYKLFCRGSGASCVCRAVSICGIGLIVVRAVPEHVVGQIRYTVSHVVHNVSYGIPGVITGFEPVDVLQGIAMIMRQLHEGRADIEIAYARGVMPEGNPVALAAIDEVFETCAATWRGLGEIPGSGYRIRDEFAEFDAMRRFQPDVEPVREHAGCRCGDVLRGIMAPNQCPLFRTVCTPENPVGPCMVSSEGSCAAYYRYY